MENQEIVEAINLDKVVPPMRDIQKMQYYKNRGSNPTRLVNDIRGNLDKLASRYFLSIVMDWQEFALAVEKAQAAGILNPAFSQSVMDIIAIQAANSDLKLPEINEAIFEILNKQDKEKEKESENDDNKLDSDDFKFDAKFSHVI